jgi:hypothetical protein
MPSKHRIPDTSLPGRIHGDPASAIRVAVGVASTARSARSSIPGGPGRSRPGADAVRRSRPLGAQGPRPLAGYRKAVLCPGGNDLLLAKQVRAGFATSGGGERCRSRSSWRCPWVSIQDRSRLLPVARRWQGQRQAPVPGASLRVSVMPGAPAPTAWWCPRSTATCCGDVGWPRPASTGVPDRDRRTEDRRTDAKRAHNRRPGQPARSAPSNQEFRPSAGSSVAGHVSRAPDRRA